MNFHKDVALHIGLGCYVEAKKDKGGRIRGGNVTFVTRNKRGLATSVRAEKYDEKNNVTEDAIKINEIYFYEPYSDLNQLEGHYWCML